MDYAIGIDLGTSGVKALLVDRAGGLRGEASRSYPLYREQPGFSEQEPEDWVTAVIEALGELVSAAGIDAALIKGISFSGQMHGLVLVDREGKPLRRAILWNDTRTTAQCRQIEERLGERLLDLARNRALEGFTLPKLLWVQQHEPELLARAATFVLPKDYVRFRLGGTLAIDYSDAAGTLLLDVAGRRWSGELAAAFGLPAALLPPLLASEDFDGTLRADMAAKTGLSPEVRLYAGGADNACGAIGAGILVPGQTMCSIGTSGVILSYEANGEANYGGKLHMFNHGKRDAYYAMGVTLAAGDSLSWFRQAFAPSMTFDELLALLDETEAGADGLLFAPYVSGERTPHADALIRASFVGLDAAHGLPHLTRAVVEGITFSLRESLDLLRGFGHAIDGIVSIGGGARSERWLQMQADLFGVHVHRLDSEQGPALGAAMLAACGLGWYETLEACAAAFVRPGQTYSPCSRQVERYNGLYGIYKQLYAGTRHINRQLSEFRSDGAAKK